MSCLCDGFLCNTGCSNIWPYFLRGTEGGIDTRDTNNDTKAGDSYNLCHDVKGNKY